MKPWICNDSYIDPVGTTCCELELLVFLQTFEELDVCWALSVLKLLLPSQAQAVLGAKGLIGVATPNQWNGLSRFFQPLFEMCLDGNGHSDWWGGITMNNTSLLNVGLTENDCGSTQDFPKNPKRQVHIQVDILWGHPTFVLMGRLLHRKSMEIPWFHGIDSHPSLPWCPAAY